MKRAIYIFTIALTVVGCNKFDLNYDASTMQNQDKETINNNATNIFGTIDPSQNWNSVNSGQVTVMANADMTDIVKVQILTESPFLNPNARVLNEAEATNGQTVTLSFEAPNAYPQLVAACVNSKGNYHIQVFDATGSKTVSFAKSTRSARRANGNEAPTFTTLKLKAPHKSLNAQRAAQGETVKIGNYTYDLWYNSGWEDEMWEIADGNTFDNGWQMDSEKDRGHVFRTLNGFDEGEEENVKTFINNFLYKYDKGGWNGKKNNIAAVRNSANFKTNNNYVVTDGKNPVTLIPIQAWTTEFKKNHVYYYYYKPEDIPAGMSETDYIKKLPKFKAVQVERVETTAESNAGAFFRRQEFLLPFFKNAPVQGNNEASAIFPAGYRVGFLNMKYDSNYNLWSAVTNGCTYGDGQLNYEVNHLNGHFLSAMDKSLGGQVKDGMNFTDPRIAVFSANGKSYLTFEDGADCTFSDMVFEIGGGTEQVEEVYTDEEIVGAAYTMCFEDRPMQADYDLNDVVLRCIRRTPTKLQLSLVACGGNDDVVIHGATGWQYNDMEVHKIFEAEEPDSRGNRFVNTEVGGVHLDPMASFVTVPEGTTIPQFLKGIFIENKTTGKIIQIAKQGEAPFAIIVPQEFDYPMEKQTITTAYQNFINWAQDLNSSKDWYLLEDADKIFPSLFKTW